LPFRDKDHYHIPIARSSSTKVQNPSMVQETALEAVRNRKTTKLFILVDDTLGTRYKVINPAGEVLILPDLLFAEDPVLVHPSEFTNEFSEIQLDAFAKFQAKAAAQEALAKAAALRAPEPRRIDPEPPKKKKTPSARKESAAPTRRGLGAAWSSPRLTFYKHKIEPLHAKQSFKVSVEGTGDFEITKEEFLLQFNDAVMSPSYRSDGLYTYAQIPEKAWRYRKT